MNICNIFIKQLTTIVGAENLYTDPADCYAYGYDNSRKQTIPDGVVFATTHAQVAAITQLCYTHKIILITRGRGTNTVGATLATQGGIVLSLERMNKILTIDPANRVMIVEPGVLNSEVQKAAGAHGFFWAPDPTSAGYSSIGGNLGCNAAGPRAVKYGTTRDNTLGLTCVTGTGETIQAGVYTTKGVVGYDLTRLIIGSEGTLAIITQATLKLTPLPETTRTLRAVYNSISGATLAVTHIMNQANTPSALEFADTHCVNIINNNHPGWLPENTQALLMIEVDGNQDIINNIVEIIKKSATNHNLIEIQVAENKQESDKLWQARKSLSASLRQLSPNKINEDVVVPVSKIPELIDFLNHLSEQYQFPIVNFGHAGNGNIHVNLLVDAQDALQGPKAWACLDQVFDKVLDLKGTLSGEHGVGTEKRAYVHKELSPTVIQLMKNIKAVFDPENILNPGKMF